MNLASIKIGQMIADRYRVERVLAEGGMGVVVVARHLELDSLVAIKFLHPQMAAQADAIARFTREARAVAQLKTEHVVRMLDIRTLDADTPFMVMEYLDGFDLEQIVEREGALPPSKAVEYLLQACSGIGEAHAIGIVHRDLKPANLFVTARPDGSECVKVLDFGVSKIMANSPRAATNPKLTKASEIFGSPTYMSPEQINSAAGVDARTDIWALGAILYELLTGRTAFAGETIPQVFANVLLTEPPSLRSLKPDVPEGLEAVVLSCLKKDRAERYPNVVALAEALEPFAGAVAGAGDRPPRPIMILSRAFPDPGPSSSAMAHAHDAETVHPSALPRSLRPFVLGGVGLVGAAVALALFLRNATPDPVSPAPAPEDVPAARATEIPAPTPVATPSVAVSTPVMGATASAAVQPRVDVRSIKPPINVVAPPVQDKGVASSAPPPATVAAPPAPPPSASTSEYSEFGRRK